MAINNRYEIDIISENIIAITVSHTITLRSCRLAALHVAYNVIHKYSTQYVPANVASYLRYCTERTNGSIYIHRAHTVGTNCSDFVVFIPKAYHVHHRVEM
jgi:hypothetical protein